MNSRGLLAHWLYWLIVPVATQPSKGGGGKGSDDKIVKNEVVEPLPIGFQPYEQSDIGPNDCLSPSGDGSKVTCTDIPSLWVLPINADLSYPIGAAADVGVKKMAEMINREQRLLPGYRLVPTSIDDADSEQIAFDRAMTQLIESKKWVAMGTVTDNAGKALNKFVNNLQIPLLAGGPGLTVAPETYEHALLHWWSYQNAFTGLMHMLFHWGVETVHFMSETYIDPKGLLRRSLKTIAEGIGLETEEQSVDTGSYIPGEPRPNIDHKALGWSTEKGSPKDIKVWFVIIEDIKLIQAIMCEYVDESIAGWLWILSDGQRADFFTVGDKDSKWRAKCKGTDEDLENLADIMVARPVGVFDDRGPPDDTILGCFPQDSTLEYARSKNGTVHSFLEMMKSVTVKGGVYPFEDNRMPLYSSALAWPGYSSSMMCQLALALKELFDDGMTLQQLQERKESQNILKKMNKAMKNQKFNGAWGPVAFSKNSNLREWRTEYFIGQNRTWVKFGEWNPSNQSYTIDPSVIPEWKSGARGWDNIPSEELKCGPGEYPNLHSCEKCPAGTWGKKFRGKYKCEDCSRGKYSEEVGRTVRDCHLTERGHFTEKEHGNSRQTPCQPGTYQSFMGKTACNVCEAGSFSNMSGATECERCGAGTYAESAASVECDSCGFDFTTQMIGSFSVLDCGCEPGKYSPCILDDAENPCKLNRTGYSSCTSCPEGFECPGFHEQTIYSGNVTKTHMQPKLLLGNFATVNEPYNAYTCLHAEDLCLGGARRGDDGCGGNRLGLQCNACKAGWFSKKGVECAECTGGGGYLLVPLAAIIVCIILRGVYMINERGLLEEENRAETNISLFAEDCSALASSLIAFLSTCQILALFSSFSLRWPAKADSFFRIFSVLLSDMEVLGASCFVGSGALVSVYLPNLLGPVAVLVLMCLTVSVCFVLSKITKMVNKMDVDIARNSIGSIIQTMAVALGASVLTIFECTENPSADATLRSFDGFYCYGDEVMALLPLAIIGILAYIGGVVAWFSYIIYVAPRKYHASRIFRKRNRFLVQRWAPDKYWYGLPLLIRNYLMSMVPTMTIDPLKQLILAFIFMGVLYMVMLRNQPWRQHLVNDADAVLTGSIFLVLFFGMALMPRAEGSDIEAMSMAMILTFCGAICTSVLILIHSAIKTRFKQHPNQLQPDSRYRFFHLVSETSKVLKKDKVSAEKAYNAYFNGTSRVKRADLDHSLNEFLAYILNDEKAQKGIHGIRRTSSQMSCASTVVGDETDKTTTYPSQFSSVSVQCEAQQEDAKKTVQDSPWHGFNEDTGLSTLSTGESVHQSPRALESFEKGEGVVKVTQKDQSTKFLLLI